MGDFSANFHRPESGIHTVEGNVAGSRAAILTRKREASQREFEERKRQLHTKSTSSLLNANRFTNEPKDKIKETKVKDAGGIKSAEEVFREKTTGLVTIEEFQKASREAESGAIDASQQGDKSKKKKTLNKKK